MTQTARPYIRPGALINFARPLTKRLGFIPALIVRGRRSGQLLTVPMGEPLEYGGARYLVSGRGETHWVRNLRAADRAEFRYHGKREPFRAVEVVGAARDEVVAAYRRKLGHSVDRYFEEIPETADHPVFRMEPIPEPRR